MLFDSEEFKKSPDYFDFIDENSGNGVLKVQAYTANQAYPLEGVEIKIYKNINGEDVTFYSGVTDTSGIIDDIVLPAKPGKKIIESSEDIVFTNYNLEASYPKANVKREYEIAMFDDLKVIQPIRIPIMSLLEGEEN